MAAPSSLTLDLQKKRLPALCGALASVSRLDSLTVTRCLGEDVKALGGALLSRVSILHSLTALHVAARSSFLSKDDVGELRRCMVELTRLKRLHLQGMQPPTSILTEEACRRKRSTWFFRCDA